MSDKKQIRLDCDRRRVSRDSDEYEGGWYHYTVSGEQQDVDWKSNQRWPTYALARLAAESEHTTHYNAGWKRKMLSWNFTSHSLDGYPGWQIEKNDGYHPTPAFVKMKHVRRAGEDVESSTICNGWDDVAAGDFYQRDWTDDGIPFCNNEEVYWSGWWFETIAERDRFVVWVQETHPKLGEVMSV